MNFIDRLLNGNLVLRILVAMVLAVVLSFIDEELAKQVGILGEIFVKSLRAVAPLLIFMLILSTIANKPIGGDSKIKPVLLLYFIGTFAAALVAVAISFMFPVKLQLVHNVANISPPGGVTDVLRTVIFNLIDNPTQALVNGNFLGILVWSIGLGLALRKASDSTKAVLADLSDAVFKVVKFVIALAPVGIFGIVAETIVVNGAETFISYAKLLAVLLSGFFIVMFILNPLIVFFKIKRNPYPLTFRCLRESGITAFFTRSSAANIPVNINLAEKLNLKKDIYSIAIPLGANINMAGAAITVTTLSLAAAYTLDIQVSFFTALILSFIASICAAGSSGVPGGSLLLIPIATSLFNIPNDVAAQVVGVGFLISVVQDSVETALNSSTDILFVAAVSQSTESLEMADAKS